MKSQGSRELGKGLLEMACAPDGITEAAEFFLLAPFTGETDWETDKLVGMGMLVGGLEHEWIIFQKQLGME